MSTRSDAELGLDRVITRRDFGGEAKRNDFDVDGVRLIGPQGSNDFSTPGLAGDADDYFTALDMPRSFAFVEPTGAAAGMRIPLDNYDFVHWQYDNFDLAHFFAGSATPWVKDIWRTGLESTPWSPAAREGFRRIRTTAITPPEWSDERLDTMTLKVFYTPSSATPSAPTLCRSGRRPLFRVRAA